VSVHVRIAGPADVDAVADLAMRLYTEGEHEASPAAVVAVARSLGSVPHAYALLACDGDGGDAQPVALMTLVESVAMYAHGRFGIIQELYVAQGRRGQGVGRALMDEAKRIARRLGWTRLEVTATAEHILPESARFYRALNFEDSGPRLKLPLE
jgi:GNAT superfamily N-acetyltransferase